MDTIDRQEAKRSILSTETSQPYDDKIENARQLDFELQKEENRHKEKSSRMSMGFWGLLGDKDHAPNNVAFIAVLAAFAAFGICLIAAAQDVQHAELWSRQAERSLAVAGTALAYIFGRGASRPG